MRAGVILAGTCVGGPAIACALFRAAEAHEKWFIDPRPYPLRAGEALADPLTWLAIGGAIVLWMVAMLLWRWRGRRAFIPGPGDIGGRPEAKDTIYALVPLVLAVHLGVALLVNALNDTLLSPNIALEGIWDHIFTVGQVGVMLGLFYGTPTRLIALLLALMWGVGIIVVGVEPMLENVYILGFSAFFYCAGRGPLSVDRVLFPKWEPSPALVVWAVPLLRIGIGLSLIIVAFTEKLLNVPLGVAFLARHPLNFLPALGMPVTDAQFVLMTGAVELLVGLCIMTGVFLRDVILMIWFPFNLTMGIFGPVELVGHFPFYGAMALFFVWGGPHAENVAAWQRGILHPSLGALLE